MSRQTCDTFEKYDKLGIIKNISKISLLVYDC